MYQASSSSSEPAKPPAQLTTSAAASTVTTNVHRTLFSSDAFRTFVASFALAADFASASATGCHHRHLAAVD